MTHIYRSWFFLKRGFLLWAGYRTALMLSLAGSVVSLIQFGWMARFVSAGNQFPLLATYGGDLMSYFLIGSAFTAFVTVALRAFQENVRAEQRMGTLESLFLADVPVPLLVVYLALWPFTYTLLNVIVLFGLIVWLFRVPLHANVLTTGVVLLFSTLGLTGVGLTSAGIILITKRGDPVHWLFSALTSLFAGVFYPVESLPDVVRPLSAVLPTTYALHALRLSLLRGADLTDIHFDLMVLLLMSAVTLPLGFITVHYGGVWVRRRGTLAEY